MSSSTFSSRPPSGGPGATGGPGAAGPALAFALAAPLGLVLVGLVSDALRDPRAGGPEARVLFIGSSHAEGALDPAVLPWPSAFLTAPGLDLALAEAAWTAHAADGPEGRWPRLERVVIELDEYTLFTDRVEQQRHDLSHLLARLDLDLLELPPGPHPWRRRLDLLKNALRGRGFAALHPDRRPSFGKLWTAWTWHREPPPTGGGPVPPEADPPLPRRAPALDPEAGRVGIATVERLTRDAPGRRAALIRLTETLRRRGLEVVFVTYPSHPIYTEARPPAWDAAIAEAAEAACGGRPPCPRWLDLRRHPLPDAAFTNVTHLNPAGARRFTRHLVERLAAEAGR